MSLSEVEIGHAMQQRLAAVPDIPPIIWPNRDAVINPPCVICTLHPVSRIDRTLDASAPISRGFMAVAVVAAPNTFATAARVTAQSIIDHFAPGTEITIATGKVVIGDSTSPMGYLDGTYWRESVKIDFYAF